MTRNDRIVILGAGPTGLGAAWRLAELGHTNWRLVERSPHVGGLASSFRDEQGFLWDFAVHVAHSHYHYFDRLMETVLPEGFYHHERRAWVRTLNAWVPYPFQYNFRHLPPAASEACRSGLHARSRIERPASFAEWIATSFGSGIAKHFMTPYNTKIWCTRPEDMNCHWLGERVPSVDLERVERNLAEGRDDVSWGPNHTFQFPMKGGTGAIWSALAAKLPAGAVQTGVAMTGLDASSRTIAFSDGSTDRYDQLISTIPLPDLAARVGDAAITAATAHLRFTRVQVVCVACDFPIPAELADKTWIYCPEDTVFYRVTPFSIFSPDHVPHPDRQCSFMCEVSTPPEGAFHDEAVLARRTLEGLRASGIVQADETNSRVFHLKSGYGYPVPTVDRDAWLEGIVPELEKKGIFSRGRFGGWKYEVANMDHSVMQGVEAVNRILLEEPEVTWRSPATVNAGKR